MHRLKISALGMIFCFGCSQSSSFEGGGGKGAEEEVAAPAITAEEPTPVLDENIVESTTPATPDTDAIVVGVCDDPNSGITQAKLLTESVVNGGANESIDYEIFLTDCDGNVKSINGEQILFDLNASVRTVSDPISYKIVEKNNEDDIKAEGPFIRDNSGDLFGDPEGVAHWKTAQLNFETKTNVVILKINISTIRVTPTGGFVGAVDMIDTYLRIGEAEPVTKTVAFTNPGAP